MNFEAIFEKYAPHFVWEAWDFARNDSRVDTVWVLLLRNPNTGSATASAAYRVQGKVCQPPGLPTILPGFEYDDGAPRHLFRSLLLTYLDFVGELTQIEHPDIPSFTVLRFRTADEDFTADFHYGHLGADADEDAAIVMGDSLQRWCDRVERTDNDSASTAGMAPA